MTWENKPKDLDATTKFGQCLITVTDPADESLKGVATRSCTDHASGTRGDLDIDNDDKNNSDKPETTTLTGVNGKTGKIFFHVDNWWRIRKAPSCTTDPKKCAPIAESKAKVQVYGPDTTKAFAVGKDGVASADGKSWYVFSIDAKTGIVSPC